MKRRSGRLPVSVLILILLVAGSAAAQGDPAATAFGEGKALGKGAIDGAYQGIGSANAAATVPGFGQTASPAQYFQAGQGQLSGPGAARISDCATLPPEAEAYRRQECEAINFLARHPAVRPAFSIDRAHDPLIRRAHALTREPSMSVTGIPAGTRAESCRVVSETQPATFSRESCHDYRAVTNEFCSTARQIRVDQHHRYQCVEQQQRISHAACFVGQHIAVGTHSRYQCDQTVQSHESLSCRRGVSVSVGFGQCTPGVWLGRAAYVDCARCLDPYMAMNVFCGGDGRSYEVEPYRSSDGVNRFDYRAIGYPWEGSYGRFPVAVAPGQSLTDHFVSDLGFGCHLYVYFSVTCSATTCTPSMRNVSAGCNSAGGSGTGAPLQLPMSRTLSAWRSSECAILEQQAQ